MKKGIFVNKSHKIIITLLVMLALVAMSIVAAFQISKLGEQRCWDTLYQSIDQVDAEITEHIHSDQELLESISTIIAAGDSLTSPDTQQIIDEFLPNTMISNIGLLLPDDQVMLPHERKQDASGILSFAEESALGKHVSDRSVSILDEERLVLRNFVPVVKNGETIAMLYGVIDLADLPEKLKANIYDGQAAVYLADGKTGDFILDTWHKSLGNIAELGGRKAKAGYSVEQLQDDFLHGKSGHCVFVSKSIGECLYFYYEPASINQWEIGISVPESVAFASVKKINRILLCYLLIEQVLLIAYFIYILLSTRRELLEKQRLAECDVLTGLLNRNCFEHKLEAYAHDPKKSLTCIYMDANGLHELNNTQGHAAGDAMLRTVAVTVQEYFGTRDSYRIGGDEFLSFAKDESLKRTQEKAAKIQEALTKQDYHVSIGICRQEMPVDIDIIVKEAEKQMYEAKQQYYREKGLEGKRKR